MAFIRYLDPSSLPADSRVPDSDHIIQIHSVHPRVMRLHYELYLELMRGDGPLTRMERELVAVAVSRANDCHY
jgi:hypothetical protein